MAGTAVVGTAVVGTAVVGTDVVAVVAVVEGAVVLVVLVVVVVLVVLVVVVLVVLVVVVEGGGVGAVRTSSEHETSVKVMAASTTITHGLPARGDRTLSAMRSTVRRRGGVDQRRWSAINDGG